MDAYLEMVLAVLGDGDCANLEMHLEAVIMRTSEVHLGPSWCEFGGVLRGVLGVSIGRRSIGGVAQQELRLY